MIAKRWLYSQLIDDGIWPDECTELLIAAQFMKTSPKCITNSPQTGFIRFLQILANTDWKSELFLVNFNGAMEETEISDLEQRFSTERDTFPPLCIATSYDLKHYGKIWTSEQQPNIHVLARVTILARQCLEIIESTLLSSNLRFIKPSTIFKAPTQGYDLIIQLKPEAVPNTLAFEFGSLFVGFTKPNWHMPMAGCNYIKYAVEKLRDAYADFAAFFYNPCGGKEIAVVWKPTAFDAKEFKVNDVYGCSLAADRKRIQAKKEVFIEDFKFILKDFLLRIGSLDAIQQANEKTSTESINSNKRYFATAKSAVEKQNKFVKKPAVMATKDISKNVSKLAEEKPRKFVNIKKDIAKHISKPFKSTINKKQKLKTSVIKKTMQK